MSEPEGYGLYRRSSLRIRNKPASRGRDVPSSDENIDDKKEPSNQTVSLFNGKFQDVEELRRNGEVTSTIRHENDNKRKRRAKVQFGDYSLLLRRIIETEEDAPPDLQLEIHSEILRHQFARLACYISSINIQSDPIVIPEPYMELYYCRENIQSIMQQDNPEGEETRRELQLLIDFQEEYMADTIKEIQALKDRGVINYNCLWALFTPGDYVICQIHSAAGNHVGWCTQLRSYKTVKWDGMNYWSIVVTYTAFNEKKFGTVKQEFVFPYFSGTVRITELPAYPLKFHKAPVELAERAVNRGKMYEQYCMQSSAALAPPVGTLMAYSGPIWTKWDDSKGSTIAQPPWMIWDDNSVAGCVPSDTPTDWIKGRVMVDVEGLAQYWPALRNNLLPKSSDHQYDTEDLDGNDDASTQNPREESSGLKNDELLTCPPLVGAFSFSARKWGLVLVEKLTPTKWNPSAFEKLKIGDSTKSTLRQLVQNHSSGSTDFDDVIKGKGRGLVFLLHGPPGCGKTMTAESVAEMVQKPIHYMNGGDLGTSPTSIQNGLESAFHQIARWDAILLLDEADAFLEERHQDHLERNAIVSVFLRLLEYQSGVVFLTTNRIENFDKAIHSRIHVTVAYPDLTRQFRESIWRDLAGACGCVLSDQEAAKLSALKVDGRRIKNFLRLASLMSKTRGKEASMKYSDIKGLLEIGIGGIGPTDIPGDDSEAVH